MNRLSLFLSGLLVSIIAVFCIISPVSAHEVETDGTISAILHFSTEDNLLSGTPASYTLFFNDTTHRLTLSGCDCTISVIKNGQTLATQSPQQDSQGNAVGTLTFPAAGDYDIVFHGTPLQTGAFQPFHLTYDEHVDAGPTPIPLSLIMWLSAGTVIVLGGLMAWWLWYRRTLHGEKKKLRE